MKFAMMTFAFAAGSANAQTRWVKSDPSTGCTNKCDKLAHERWVKKGSDPKIPIERGLCDASRMTKVSNFPTFKNVAIAMNGPGGDPKCTGYCDAYGTFGLGGTRTTPGCKGSATEEYAPGFPKDSGLCFASSGATSCSAWQPPVHDARVYPGST